jgi:hypothetical protein
MVQVMNTSLAEVYRCCCPQKKFPVTNVEDIKVICLALPCLYDKAFQSIECAYRSPQSAKKKNKGAQEYTIPGTICARGWTTIPGQRTDKVKQVKQKGDAFANTIIQHV